MNIFYTGILLFLSINLEISYQLTDPTCAPYVPPGYDNNVSPSKDTVVNFDYVIINIDDVDVATYVRIF